MVPPERADEWARRLEALRKTVQEIIDYRHEDVASFFPDWLREEDDRYANVHPIELFYDAVREKYGVDGDRGMVEGMKRAAKAKAAAAPAAVGGKRQIDEVDSDTTDDESCAPRWARHAYSCRRREAVVVCRIRWVVRGVVTNKKE